MSDSPKPEETTAEDATPDRTVPAATAPGESGPDELASATTAPGKSQGAAALLEQVGGISGLIYSSLPVLVFVPVSSAFGLTAAIGAALTVAALILVWRLVRRETTQPAISGFFGVGICALIAWVVGESKGYFLLGIWSSLIWASVFAISILIRRPVVGYVWGWAGGHGQGWRKVRRAVLVFDLATATWVLVFASRFIVQNTLYEDDQTGWLGVARIAMGYPLTAVAALVTYLAIKAAQKAIKAADATDGISLTKPESAAKPESEAARPSE